MQELIQAEIAKATREAAEKCVHKLCIPRQRILATLQASDNDIEDDGSFVGSSGDSSEDDELDTVVKNTELLTFSPLVV